jgi:hypothetical protein
VKLICLLEPATFHYQDPTPKMQKDPLGIAIWNEFKTWDINVPTAYVGYTSATGSHVTAIYLALLKTSIAEIRYMRSARNRPGDKRGNLVEARVSTRGRPSMSNVDFSICIWGL